MEKNLLIILVNGVDDHIGRGKDKTICRNWFLERFPRANIEIFDFLPGKSYSSLSEDCIRDGAKDIIVELNKYQTSNTPITFIGYNIGASIIKQLLLLASEQRGDEWISLNAIALYFVEYPVDSTHLGWEQFFLDLLAAHRVERTDISRLLNSLPDVLYHVDTNFYNISDAYNIVSFSKLDGSLTTPLASTWGSCDDDPISEKIFLDIDKISRMKHMRLSDEYQDFERYFSRSVMPTFQLRSVEADPDALSWIRTHDTYNKWLSPSGADLLCINDSIDSETTVISASILHYLRASNRVPESKPSIFVSFRFDQHDVRRCTEWSLLVSILRQLLSLKFDLFGHARQMCKALSTQASVSCGQLWSLLRHVLAIEGRPHMYLFVDSISQCQPSNLSSQPLTGKLASLATSGSFSNLKILIAGSYKKPDREAPNTVLHIDLAVENGWRRAIRQVASQRVLQIIALRPVWRKFEANIVDKVCSGEYTYSDVILHLRLLENSKIRSTRVALLNQLMVPILSTDQVFETILSQLSEPSMVKHALNWIHHTRRPLNLSELSVVLALRPQLQGAKGFDHLVDTISWDIGRDLHEIQGSIIKIVDHQVHFVHHAFRKYFESRSDLYIDNFHSTIVERCVEYIALMADHFADTASHDVANPTTEEVSVLAFFDYANLYWPEHYKILRCPIADLDKSVQEFLRGKCSSWMWTARCKSSGWKDIRKSIGEQPLSLAVYYGLSRIVNSLLARPNSLPSGEIQTAMDIAAINGDRVLLRTLLSHSESGILRSTLCLAAQYGNTGVIEDFYDYVSISLSGNCADSPLLFAAGNGHTETVKTLLAKNADVTCYDASENTAFHLAAQIGDVDTLISLRDISQEETGPWTRLNKDKYSPLQLAAYAGHFETVQTILHYIKGAGIDRGEGYTMTALQLAAMEGHRAIVNLLLSAGASLDTSPNTLAPLQLSVQEGHLDVVIELLDRMKHDESLQDACNMALHTAVREGQTDVLKYLLEKQPIRSLELNGNMMQSAFSNGYIDVIKALVSAGGNLTTASYFYRTLFNDYVDIAKYLVEHVPPDVSKDWLVPTAMIGRHRIARVILKQRKEVKLPQRDYCRALEIAAKRGKVEFVREMLWHKDVLSQTMDGQKPPEILVGAVLDSETPQIVELLFENGWNSNYCNTKGDTVLHIACQQSQKDIVQVLLQHGAMPDETNRNGQTPLHVAVDAYNGNLGIIKLLLGTTRNLDKQDNDGITALHIATKKGDEAEELVKLLLGLVDDTSNTEESLKKADVCIATTSGWTALHFASRFPRITSTLLRRNPNIDAELHPHNLTPLLLAIANGSYEVVKLLLEANANYNARDRMKRSALYLAASNGSLPMVKELLKARVVIDETDCNMRTPLSKALDQHYFDVADYLLDKGADPKLCKFPLEIAAQAGSESTVGRLLEKGINVNAQSELFGSALHAAVFAANEAMVSLLLGSKASPDMMARPFGAPLHAMFYNYSTAITKAPAIVKLLINEKADINCLDYYERTPLMVAVRHPDATLVYLLELGSNPNVKDKTSATVLHYAALLRSSEEIKEMLRRSGDPTIDDGCKRDVLYWAAMSVKKSEEDRAATFKALMSALPETEREQSLRATLHPAVARHRKDILDSILEEKLDMNGLDRNNWSALDIAISYGLDDTQALLEEKGATTNSKQHKRPSSWSSNDRSCMVTLSADGMVATMKGSGIGLNGFQLTGSIRSNYCIPYSDSRFYFEVEIMESSSNPIVGIGVSEENVSVDQFVGWEKGSWGYHGDDGNCYNAGVWKWYGPEYGRLGDVIGCGIDDQTIFYTKNGEEQGTASEGVRGQLYPTVSFQRQLGDTKILVNFGGSPFRYQRKEKKSE